MNTYFNTPIYVMMVAECMRHKKKCIDRKLSVPGSNIQERSYILLPFFNYPPHSVK